MVTGTAYSQSSMGAHFCSFCPDDADKQETVVFDGHRFGLGAANLFLPAEGTIYVAPSLIVHYIRDHSYLPPEPFCEAVRTCPPVTSDEYCARWDAVCPPDWRGRIAGLVKAVHPR